MRAILKEGALGERALRLLPECFLIEKGEESSHPTHVRVGIQSVTITAPRGEMMVSEVILVQGKTDLSEVVLTGSANCDGTQSLHRREEQAHEDGENGKDNDQLDQCESGTDWTSKKEHDQGT